VNLSSLSNVQEVGGDFLTGCSSLTRVILPASPPEALQNAVRSLPCVLNTLSSGKYGTE